MRHTPQNFPKPLPKNLFWMFALITLSFAAPANAQMTGNEWINMNQTYLKIPVAKTGIYRITQTELAAKGVAGLGRAGARRSAVRRCGPAAHGGDIRLARQSLVPGTLCGRGALSAQWNPALGAQSRGLALHRRHDPVECVPASTGAGLRLCNQ